MSGRQPFSTGPLGDPASEERMRRTDDLVRRRTRAGRRPYVRHSEMVEHRD